METAQSLSMPLDPFPLLTLPDLVLQHILQHLTPKERKATRGTCRKLCKVASDSGKNDQPQCATAVSMPCGQGCLTTS
jgi:hypothetical protein